MSRVNGASGGPPRRLTAITSLSVAGFKSIVEEQTVAIRPLTLLAGANSSGKSSMMQPLLLLKQTLEAPYDPGPLRLDGPNVKFTSVGQFWPALRGKKGTGEFIITIRALDGVEFSVGFGRDKEKAIVVLFNDYKVNREIFRLRRDAGQAENVELLSRYESVVRDGIIYDFSKIRVVVEPLGFFLELALVPNHEPQFPGFSGHPFPAPISLENPRFGRIRQSIREVIHLPGLRGNPERVYPVAAIGPRFPGTFESYVASMIASWMSTSSGRVGELSKDLRLLGLAWKVEATPINDTQVELRVGRTPRPRQGGAKDLVNIADVGFGVSQTLPVVVALRAALPGQLVYIEQPEIHLHPRAQVAMARLLVNAANRGVRVVAETHSSLILLGVQTLVAEGVIQPGLVGLNWFVRDEKDGTTRIKTAELDEAGRFGDWPEDFDEVALEAENRYLSAAEERLAKG
jgi:hypothetical protein